VSSLTKQQQTTLVYIVGLILLLGLSGGMLYSLNASKIALTKQRQDVESKEAQSRRAEPATLEEQSKWTEQEGQINSILIPEQEVPQLFEEVTRIATESGIQRLGMNTEETAIDPAKAGSGEEANAVAVGIKHYLAVTMKFQGQYSDIALFLGNVARLGRPIEYHVLDLKRNAPLIEVQLVMNVFKREPA